MIRNSDLTKNPKLYKETYWGSFQVEKEQIKDEIIANRNKFTKEFEVIEFIDSKRPKADSKLFDHCELYKTKNGLIYITSPYDDVSKEAEEYGFSKYLKLYHPASNTYIKQFFSKSEYNKFIKSIES